MEKYSKIEFHCQLWYDSSMKTEKIYKILPWALFVLGILSYVSLIFNNNVWMDEAFTASLVRTDMAGVISRSMADTLPPLYNIYLKIMTDIFGYAIPVMKFASVIPMILTMLLSVTVVRKRHGNIASSIFTAALFSMPYLYYFGVEIRMYSLGFFFATASGIFAYEVLYDSCLKNWIWFTVFSVLAGYSHHFAFVTVGAVYLYLFLYYIIRDRAHIKRFFLCLLSTFILYFPCLVVTLKQLSRVSGYFSMPEVTLKVFIKYMYYPYTVGVTFLSVLLLLIVILFFVKCVFTIFKDRERASVHMYALFMFLIYYGVLLFGTAISKVMTANIFVDRYLFFAFGLIWLFFAIEGSTFSEPSAKSQSLHLIMSSAVLIMTLVIGIASYRSELNIEYGVNPNEMISYLSENVAEGDALVIGAKTEAFTWCLPFYQPNFRQCSLKDAIDLKNSGECKNIWIAIDKADSTIDDVLESSDFAGRAEYIKDFKFDRYEMELYSLNNL